MAAQADTERRLDIQTDPIPGSGSAIPSARESGVKASSIQSSDEAWTEGRWAGSMRRWGWALAAGIWSVCLSGCARPVIVEPKPTVDAYLRAVQSGDADAMYAMMSEESRRMVSREDLRRVLADQKSELVSYAAALSSKERRIRTQAAMRFDDGEVIVLELRDGQFRLAAGDALPAAARSPVQALGQLRRVLARRSYTGLLQVLTPRTRAAMESELRSLVRGLERPESLRIRVGGDKATVEVPGGHKVTLKLRDGVWRVDDFE